MLENVSSHYQKKLPFVLYSLPESDSLTVMLQEDDKLNITEDYQGQCFVFSPYNYEKKAYCIPASQSEVLELKYTSEEIKINELDVEEETQFMEQYCSLVKKTINTIANGYASKIVVSRSKILTLRSFQIKDLILRLLNLYPFAFRYVWYHPKTGLWCGASPEVLVKTDGLSFTTMALAGTQKYQDNKSPIWTYKDREEQKIVLDAISDRLQKVTSVLKISKTYNRRAASVVHLCTDITGILKKVKANLPNIISYLHPTPAICGSPQKNAKEYINKNEDYDREFYTGFLGPVYEKRSSSNLFVNLRCMKINDDKVHLYAGGGITLASNPVDEWFETQNKLMTMLQVIHPML